MILYKTSEILYSSNKEITTFRNTKNIIYLGKDKDGIMYVGESSKPLLQRIKSHIRKKGTDFEKAINKRNIDDFEWGILETDLGETKKRYEREKFYIKKYKTLEKGYNMTSGGGGTKGYKHSEESVQNNILRKKKFYEDIENRKNQSKSSLIAHRINPAQAEEHSQRMKKIFDAQTEEGKKRRENASEKQREHFRKNEVQYVLNYKKPPFFAYKDGKCIGVFISNAECARMLNVHTSKVSNVLNGKRKSTKGYTFKYFERTGYLLDEL